MANILTPQQSQGLDALLALAGPKIQAAVDAACAARMQNQNGNGKPSMAQSTIPSPSAPACACQIPGAGASGGFIPSTITVGLDSRATIKCDPSLQANLALDIELYSWPLVEPQLYMTDTKLNNVVLGAFPLAAGASLTISQETDRTISYIPDYVQIATTWTGPPQDGLLSYQWQVVTQDNLTPTNPATFGNIQSGAQYFCGSNCMNVPFPSWKGCTGWPIGSLAALQLVVSLAATATSTLTGMMIAVYHRRSMQINGPFAGGQPVMGCGG